MFVLYWWLLFSLLARQRYVDNWFYKQYSNTVFLIVQKARPVAFGSLFTSPQAIQQPAVDMRGLLPGWVKGHSSHDFQPPAPVPLEHTSKFRTFDVFVKSSMEHHFPADRAGNLNHWHNSRFLIRENTRRSSNPGYYSCPTPQWPQASSTRRIKNQQRRQHVFSPKVLVLTSSVKKKW